MPEGPAISLNGIAKRFGDGPLVLENTSLTTQPGEILGIIGPSGCGKSTLLRIIAGLLPMTSGTLDHGDHNVRPAFIFQDSTLLPWATVLENIALPLRLKGLAPQERLRVAGEWARQVGLQAAAHYHPRQLSGGMRMRVSIARALSLQPNLLLLDEPFGALDAITRNRLNEELLRLYAGARWTAFFVTHSVNEAVFLANRILILGTNPGTIRAMVENPLPYPREARTRESLAYQQCVADITSRLHQVLTHDPVE